MGMKEDRNLPPWGNWSERMAEHGYEQLEPWGGGYVYKRPTDPWYEHDKYGRPG